MDASACNEYLAWLAGDPGGDPPEVLAEHVRGCPVCGSLASAYHRTLAARRAAAARHVRLPRFETVLERVHGRRRLIDSAGEVLRRWWWIAMPATAGALAAAWLAMQPGPVESEFSPVPARGPMIQASSQGSAALWAEDGTLEEVKSPRDLPKGAEILTSAGGSASIADPDIGVLFIEQDTRVRVTAWNDGSAILALDGGGIRAVVSRRGQGQSFEVRTEYAVVRVVGTEFIVRQVPGIETVVSGLSGEVLVETAAGVEVARLRAGDSTSVRAPAQMDAGSARGREPVVARQVREPPGAETAVARQRVQASARAPDSSSFPAPEDVLKKARVLLSEGRDEEAISLLAEAARGEGRDTARILALLGDAQRLAGRFEAARQSYERALAMGLGSGAAVVLVDLADLLDRRMRLPEDAAKVWKRYLAEFGSGPDAARALWEIARIDEEAGRTDVAMTRWGELVVRFPGRNEAAQAFAKLGRLLMDRGQWDMAESLFNTRLKDPDPGLAEAALVGLMMVHLDRGRADRVRSLANEYERRFPRGSRRDEVQRLLEAMKL